MSLVLIVLKAGTSSSLKETWSRSLGENSIKVNFAIALGICGLGGLV